jgi:hypothetical protein
METLKQKLQDLQEALKNKSISEKKRILFNVPRNLPTNKKVAK